jgi:hypothetical protein
MLTKEERETGKTALLWTVSEPIKRRMTRKLGQPTSMRGPCAEWTFPKSWVRLPTKPRTLSAEARAKASLSLAKRVR